MRISDWSSDVCSSDLAPPLPVEPPAIGAGGAQRRDQGDEVARQPVRPGEPVRRGDIPRDPGLHGPWHRIAEIGSASCRDRVCQDVYISVFAVAFKKT